MLRLFFLGLLISLSSITFSQIETLTSEERAYLYHIVKKSPILEHNIGRFLEYTGPEVRLTNQHLNYDSIENYIINNPSSLLIHTSEIRKSSVGILSEVANKIALWELNKTLLNQRSKNKNETNIYKTRYELFEHLLIHHLPPKAIKKEDNETSIHPKVLQLLNPSLHLNDKIKMVGTFRFLNENERFVTLTAINKAVNQYVQERSLEIFTHLGGVTTSYNNVLVAAGDGSITSGLLDEREKDEKGRWNRGLPKAIGLFPYQLKKVTTNTKDIAPIQPTMFTSNDFLTAENNKATTIHFDIWGYNSSKQTTIVIERKGKTYHLFGSGETRFLSPDSSFAGGETFQNVLNKLHEKLKIIDRKIYGKKGYDYWISFHEKRHDEIKTQVLKLEMEITGMGSYTIHTKPNGVKQKDQEVNKTKSDKKNRRTKQHQYIQKNNQLSDTKKKIVELKKEKEEALERRSELENTINFHTDVFGRNWVPFTVKDGVYTFEDSCTFDILTQDFIIPPTAKPEHFEVRLIAIPYTSSMKNSDEVMMHINVTHIEPNYNARVQLSFNDVFESNSWDLKQTLLKDKDSLSIQVFLEELLNNKKPFIIQARGNGIGRWNGLKTVYNPDQEELSSYPTSKNDTTFKRLRTSEVNIYINREILFEVNSFTDPVRTTFPIQNSKVAELKTKYNLTYNQILSAYRTAAILFKLQDELNEKCGDYFEREKTKIIIDRLNNALKKAKILVGKVSVKAELFKDI